MFRGQGELHTDDGEGVTMANHRASLNRLIEDSRVPVIWIMNRPEILDPAVRRRFDAVIAFAGIPRSVRLSVLQRRLQHLPHDPQELGRWADVPTLTPALIDRLVTLRERAQLRMEHPLDDHLSRHWLRQRLPGKSTRHLRQGSAPNALL